jgi:hypothetical protein
MNVSRIRVILTATCEFEPDSAWYPEGCTLADMVAMEKIYAVEDPETVLSYPDVDIDVEVEVVEE